MLFLQWNDSQDRYLPVKRIPITDMLAVTQDSWVGWAAHGGAKAGFVFRFVQLLWHFRVLY